MTFSIDLDFDNYSSTLFKILDPNDPNDPGKAAQQAVIDAANAWATFIKDDFQPVAAGTKVKIVNPKLSTKANQVPDDITLGTAINGVRIYIGTNDLQSPGTLASTSLGKVDESASQPTGTDINYLLARTRGLNFEPYVGSISFNTNAKFGQNTVTFSSSSTFPPLVLGQPKTDLYTVALHEIGHILGFLPGAYSDTPNTFPGAFLYGAQGSNFFFGKNLSGGVALDLNSNHFDSSVTSLVVKNRFAPVQTPSLISDLMRPEFDNPYNQSLQNLGISDTDLKFLADVGYIIDNDKVKLIPGFSGFSTVDIPLTAPSSIQNFPGYIIGGTPIADTITGNTGTDTLAGGPGNDTIYGMGGNDTLYGGNGNDSLYGDDLTGSLNLLGGDSLVGGAGDDVYYVNSKLDIVDEKPNEGNDRIVVQAPPGDPVFVFFNNKYPNNVIEKISNYTNTINQYAVAELDDNLIVANLELEASAFNVANNLIQNNLAATHDWQIYANRGNDTITGGNGNDSLYGGTGNDTVNGGIGRDSLFGGVGNDRILGDIGNDALFGGAGNDTLFGGTGTNNLQGFDINVPSATEVDTLFHSSGSLNRLFLAAPDINGVWVNGYKNGGDSDYALIKNYLSGGQDVLAVANTFTITRSLVGGNIWVRDGSELIAIVEGITNPVSVIITTAAGIVPLP